MNSLKVYSYACTGVAPHGGNLIVTGKIPTSNNPFKIRSITFDWRGSYEDDMVYPFYFSGGQPLQVNLLLLSNYPAAQPVAEAFDVDAVEAGTLSSVDNGSRITFYTPGKRNFDSFYCSNELRFVLDAKNMNANTDYQVDLSLIIEVETI